MFSGDDAQCVGSNHLIHLILEKHRSAWRSKPFV